MQTANTLAANQIDADADMIANIDAALSAIVTAGDMTDAAKEEKTSAGDMILDAVRHDPETALIQFYKVKGWQARFTLSDGSTLTTPGVKPEKDTPDGKAYKSMGIYRSHILTFVNREGRAALDGMSMGDIRNANKDANKDDLIEDVKALHAKLMKDYKKNPDAMARYRQNLREIIAAEETRAESAKAQAANG